MGMKPLGGKCYGSIPHLPGSRRGPADHGLSVEQAAILTEKPRDGHDLIVVQEKLDGSNVGVAKISNEIVPLIRAGYRADTSNYEQHHYFYRWALQNRERFNALLKDGERCVGEWLMVAHGTRYQLTHEPFVVFDLMVGTERALSESTKARCSAQGFVTPREIHRGTPFSISEALRCLYYSGHGALDPVEGAIWRCERKGKVDFLGKYVRPEKLDGCYFPEKTGLPEVFNWKPTT